jgi:glycosyltransferase involved in cell wall biosynthesis
LKILLVTGSINQGGAEFQLLALANMLQRRGFNISVLALTNHTYYKPYIVENRLSYRYTENSAKKIKQLFNAVNAIKEIQPDLVISYIRITSQVTILARVLSFFRFKLIISERTALILPLYDLFYFNLALLANKITVNSTSKLGYIHKRFPLLRDRAVFMPNIIDVKKFEAANQTKNTSTTCRITFVGRISPEKNILNLIRAIQVLGEKGYGIDLSLNGAGNNKGYLEEVNKLISDLELDNIIQYKGPTKDILEVYGNTDLLCLVSFFEGFSNVLSEAICAGIPVIASDIEENRFLVEEGVNGFLIDPNDYKSLAAGIEKFLKLPPLEKEKIAINNRRKALAVFDEEKVYQSYLDIFREIGFLNLVKKNDKSDDNL